jgi:ABC-type Fe3+ transport system substrate-binding protein
LTHSDPAAAAALAKKGMFVAFKPTHLDKVPDDAKDPDGFYVAQRINLMTIYLRTDKVPAADHPRAGPTSPTRNTRASSSPPTRPSRRCNLPWSA